MSKPSNAVSLSGSRFAGESPARPSMDRLVAELLQSVRVSGPQKTQWPGLTAYYSTSSIPAQWDVAGSLSICLLAQGTKRITVDGVDYINNAGNYVLYTRGQRLQVEVMEASQDAPYLGCSITIDPAMALLLSAEMLDQPRLVSTSSAAVGAPFTMSEADGDLVDSVTRLLVATRDPVERKILAPLILKEITFHVLRTEQCARLLQGASEENSSDLVYQVISYVQDHMGELMTVDDLARHVAMSSSAFSHLFRDRAGIPPYQFIKQMRLEEARRRLTEGGRDVSTVCREVGYSSLSHFVREFKRHFGVTPSAYAQTQRHNVALGVYRATVAAHLQST